MKQLLVSISAAVAVSFAIGTAGPAAATATSIPKQPAISSDVVQVQWRWRDSNRSHRPGRMSRYDRQHRFDRRRGYYNGWRGYRERRRGYRYHDGWWFPPTAFALGAIIGGATSRAAPQGSLSIQHVRWCEDRYRSYRASDDTFQPYDGPRRRCFSPYS